MVKPAFTDPQIKVQLDSGNHWARGTISFAFPTSKGWVTSSKASGFSPLNADQKATAIGVLGLWDDLIASRIVPANSGTAQIKLANTTTNIYYASTNYPGTSAMAGSVWFNPKYNSGTGNLVCPCCGQWGHQTYIHELGHALGLRHPGNYNGGAPSYAKDARYLQDSLQYTVMSYFDASNTGADWVASDGKHYYAQTPMMHDILAIQAIYGADTTTRAGNTVYGFHSTAGKSVYDFGLNKHPVLCIYDAKGIDTLDLSQWSTASRIDLAPGSFSDADAMTKNISIARNTWIENAIGGAGDDSLCGNTLANVLYGKGGNDQVNGREGADRLFGEYGADKLCGGTGNDWLEGGTGNDTLRGDAGNDILVGGTGKDTLVGGAGADVFTLGSASDSGTGGDADVIADFSHAELDKIDLANIDANASVAGDQSFSFVGSDAFHGVAGELRYASGTVEADVNGDGTADFSLAIANLSSLAAGDFIL